MAIQYFKVELDSAVANSGRPADLTTYPFSARETELPVNTPTREYYSATRPRDDAWNAAYSGALLKGRQMVWDRGTNLPIEDPNDPRLYIEVIPEKDVYTRGADARFTFRALDETTLQVDTSVRANVRLTSPFGDFYIVGFDNGVADVNLKFDETARNASFGAVPRNLDRGEPGYVIHAVAPFSVAEGDTSADPWDPGRELILGAVSRGNVVEGNPAFIDFTAFQSDGTTVDVSADGPFGIQLQGPRGVVEYVLTFTAGLGTLDFTVRSGTYYVGDLLGEYVVPDPRASVFEVLKSTTPAATRR